MTKPPKETSPCKFCVSLNSVFLRRPKGKFKAQKGRDNGLRCQSDPTREAARPPRKHCSGSWALGGVYSPVVIEKYTELLDEQQRSVTAGAGPTPRAFFGNWSLSLLRRPTPKGRRIGGRRRRSGEHPAGHCAAIIHSVSAYHRPQRNATSHLSQSCSCHVTLVRGASTRGAHDHVIRSQRWIGRNDSWRPLQSVVMS